MLSLILIFVAIFLFVLIIRWNTDTGRVVYSAGWLIWSIVQVSIPHEEQIFFYLYLVFLPIWAVLLVLNARTLYKSRKAKEL